MKKSFRFTVLLLLCFALLLPVHAESSISSIVEEPKRDTIIETAEIKVDPSGVLYYEITDRETLDIIADEDGIDLSDGKQLTKVITYYSDLSEPNSSEYLETTTNNTDIQPLGQTIMFEVRNVTDAGDLWYFENDTLRNSTYGPGPLSTSFTVTEQVTARYSYSGSFTILPDMLTAAVQFDVTDQYTLQEMVNLNVPRNEYRQLKIWGYHNKKNYELWEIAPHPWNPFTTVETLIGTGAAYKPNGLRVRVYEF